MNPKHAAFIQSMTNRDNTLVSLAIIACVLVLAWVLIDYVIPEKIRGWFKRCYMIGGLAMYIITIVAVLS